MLWEETTEKRLLVNYPSPSPVLQKEQRQLMEMVLFQMCLTAWKIVATR